MRAAATRWRAGLFLRAVLHADSVPTSSGLPLRVGTWGLPRRDRVRPAQDPPGVRAETGTTYFCARTFACVLLACVLYTLCTFAYVLLHTTNIWIRIFDLRINICVHTFAPSRYLSDMYLSPQIERSHSGRESGSPTSMPNGNRPPTSTNKTNLF